jgi:hypothetical protein
MATVVKEPRLVRSAGISVAFSQAPLAKALKSSPGFTDRSMPARSMPISVPAAVAGDVSLALHPASATADASRIKPSRFIFVS